MDTDTRPAVGLADVVSAALAEPTSAAAQATARIRLADTALAALIGRHTSQGQRSAALARQLYGPHSIAARAFALTAGCRLTEIDDIDLLSCTTPGSIVVPTILALLASPESTIDSAEALLDCVVHGYELVLRLGEAIDGPRLLGRGGWPTLAVGAVAAAALTSSVIGADPAELEAGVILAAQQSVDGNPRGTARENLLATAVVVGIGSALSARAGFTLAGTRGAGAIGALLPKPLPLPVDDGVERIARPAIKGFCSARQAMTAVSALREIVTEHALEPDAIERIDVEVPVEYAAMLTKPTVSSRRESLSSAAYQLALTATGFDQLLDVERATLRTDEQFQAVMARVAVHPSEELSRLYPAAWPARVQVRVGGRSLTADAKDVPGEQVVTVEAFDAKLGRFLHGPDQPDGRSVDRIRTWSLYSSGTSELRELAAVIDGEPAEGVREAHVRVN